MPITVVTGPDGQEYEVNHPEGAGDDEILQYAKRSFGGGASTTAPSPPVQPTAESPGILSQIVSGAGRGLAQGGENIVRGLGGLIGAAAQTPSDIAYMARNPREIPRILKQTGQQTVSMVTDPYAIATGLGAATAGPAGAAAGPAILQTLANLQRQVTGERVSPEESVAGVTEALTTMGAPAALGAAPRLGARAMRGVARQFPGAGVPLQAESAETLRRAVRGIQAPPATETYQSLKALQLLGGPSKISTPALGQAASLIREELTPLIPGWKIGANPRLQRAAQTLEDFISSGGNEMTLPQAQSILETLGPSVERAAGSSGGAIKKLWGETKKAVQAAADAGDVQAETLLEAQRLHRRFSAVRGTSGRGETPSLREIIERGIKPVEAAGLPEEVSASSIRTALKNPRVAQRLQQVLSPAEQASFEKTLLEASKTPRIKTGISTFMERLPLYLGAGAMGVGLGGAEGFLIAGAGAELLRRLAATPNGRAIILKMAKQRAGQVGPSSLGGLAPIVAGEINER